MKRIGINILIACFSVSLLLGLSELVLRLAGYTVFAPANYDVASPYADLIYELKPNYQGYAGYQKISLNSYGLRDKEFRAEKAEGQFRILAVGDSLTFGFGVKADETLPKQLETLLNNRAKSPRFEVLNFGVPGYNTQQEVALIKHRGLQLQPDLILLIFYANDIQTPGMRQVNGRLRPVRYTPGIIYLPPALKELLRRKSVLYSFLTLQFHQLRYQFKDYINQANGSPGGGNKITPEIQERMSKPFRDLSRLQSQGVKLLVLTYHLDARSPHPEHELVRQLTNRYSLPFFDLAPSFTTFDPKDLWVSAIDHHPNGMAHKVAAEAIFTQVVSRGLIPTK